MDKKVGRPRPDWAKKLKSGHYTIADVMKITGKSYNTIQSFMRRNAKKITQKETGNFGSKISVYEWENTNDN